MIDLGRFVQLAKETAVCAGKEILEIRKQNRVEVKIKQDGSPVTNADIRADCIIVEQLAKEFPELIFITEEMSEYPKEGCPKTEAFVLVDPLDGTKGYIKGGDYFTVNIALIVHQEPVVGIIYAPALDMLFWNNEIGAAWRNYGVDGSMIQRLRVSQVENAERIASSASKADSKTKSYIEKAYPECTTVSVASSFKFCHLAAGDVDVYPRLDSLMQWDTAAGDAIVRASGGVVYNLADRKDLQYGGESLRGKAFVAASSPGIIIWPSNFSDGV
jgi:3'(2'), 5'-bisphosphate nucleotidase